MGFLQQESTGRSGEPSRLRDKLLLYNARTRLSQQGVASLVGVSTAALRNWEAGLSKPTGQHLKRLIELYVAYKAFAEGDEKAEAADLWEAAQAKGLKVPFDERWFQELLANQQSLYRDSEHAHQLDQQHESDQEHTQEGHQEPGIKTSYDRAITENESILLPQPPSSPPLSSTHKLSRRTVVVGLACLAVGVTAGSGLTWAMLHSQSGPLSQPHWMPMSEQLQARSFFRATLLLNGQVLIEGGLLPDNSPTSTTQSELFDPTRDIWRKTHHDLNVPRAKHTATLLPNGRVLVTGGYGLLQTAELYDPNTETWLLTKEPMHYARVRHTATLLQTGKVLIAGGMPSKTTELYDPLSDNWSSSGNMTTIRYDHVAIRLLDGRVVVAGGRTKNDENDSKNITNSAELYNPATNEWTPLPPMKNARADFTAALLPDGRVLVIGGQLQAGGVTSTTEIYDPNNNKGWQLQANMNYPRLNPLGQEAIHLQDGTIMVVGGDTLGTSETYIPSSNKWVSVLRLHSPHYLGATVSLGNGHVLVAGGFDISSIADKKRITASTEIYTPGSE